MTDQLPEPAFRLETVPCDLCGSSEARLVMQKRGRLWDRTFSIVRCVECGLVYVNPRIAADQIASLYDEAYHRGDGFDRSHDHTHNDDENPTHVATIARVVATLDTALAGFRGARVLDIGCGTGTLLARLQDAGAEAEGVELSACARARCAQRELSVVGDSIDDAHLPAAAYDAITATEVIEHVISPKAFLNRVRELLKPGGVFCYTTGNWHLVRRAPGTPYVMPEGHLYYFTPNTMRRYFQKAGFDVVGGVVNRTWIGYRGLPRTVADAIPAPVLLGLSHLAGDVGQYPIGRRAVR
jgi:2-polyprenyl-3-methyl-5-hydroxy-6-metoxy-1,4-benzoquinol methylase